MIDRAPGVRRCGGDARGIAADGRRRPRRRLRGERARRRGRALLAQPRRDPAGAGRSIQLSLRDLGGGAGRLDRERALRRPRARGRHGLGAARRLASRRAGRRRSSCRPRRRRPHRRREGSGRARAGAGPARAPGAVLAACEPARRWSARRSRRCSPTRTRSSDTRGAGNAVSVYRYPTNVSPLGLPTSYDGPEQLWRFRLGHAGRQRRRLDRDRRTVSSPTRS